MSGNCPHRVIEIYTGPRGLQGLPGQDYTGSGVSGPFTYVTGSTWATTSSIEITGSLIISGSNTFKNIGPAVFSGSIDLGHSPSSASNGRIWYNENTTGITSYVKNANIAHTTFTSDSHSFCIYIGNPNDSIPIGIGSYTNSNFGFFTNFGTNLLTLHTSSKISIGKPNFGSYLAPQSLLELLPQSNLITNKVFSIRNNTDTRDNFIITDTGNVSGSFTGSLQGTASYANQALTASYALNVTPPFPFTGSAIITGSLIITGSTYINRNSSNTVDGLFITNTLNTAGAYAATSFVTNGLTSGTAWVGASSTSNTYIGASSLIMYAQAPIHLFTDANANINFSTNAVLRMRILGSGAVNILSNATVSSSLAVTGSFTVLATGSDLINIGNAAISNQRLVRIGQHTSYMDLGSFVGAEGVAAIYFNKSTPSGVNYTLAGDSSFTLLNGVTDIYFRINNSTKAQFSSTLFDIKQNTTITGSTNISGNLNLGSGSESRILTLRQDQSFITMGSFASSPSNAGIWFDTPNGFTNAALWGTATNTILNTPQTLTLRVGNATLISITSTLVDIKTITNITGSTNVQGILSLHRPLDANVTNFNINAGSTPVSAFQISTDQPNLKSIINSRNNYSMSFQTNDVERLLLNNNNFIVKTSNFDITSSIEITGSLNLTGSFTALVTGSDFVNIGNATNVSQRLVRIGQHTSFVDIGSYTGGTSNWAFYGNQSTPSSINYFLMGNATTTLLNASTTFQIQVGTTPVINLLLTQQIFSPFSTSTGGITNFSFRTTSNTNQTAASNIPNFIVSGSNKQWAVGNIANQYWNYLTANTASFTTSSFITSSYGLFVEEAIGGISASIVNNYAIGTSGSLYVSKNIGVAVAPADALHIGAGNSLKNIKLGYNGVIGANTNEGAIGNIGSGAHGFYMPGGSNGRSRLVNQFATADLSYEAYQHNFSVFGSSNRSTEYSRYIFGGGQVTFTSSLSLQRFSYFNANNVVFDTPKTLTTSYGLFVEAATSGSNTTITNNYALGTFGALHISGAYNHIFRNATDASGQSAYFLGVGAGSETSTNYTLKWDGNLNINGQNTTTGIVFSAAGSSILSLQKAATSGNSSDLILYGTAKTGQTSGTEVNTIYVPTRTRQWISGSITTQREYYFASTTYSFNSSSLITNAYGLYVEAPTMGTWATASYNYAAGFNGSIQIQSGSIAGQGIVIGNLFGSTTNSAIYMGVTPSSTNYAIRGDASGNTFINGGQLFLGVGGTSKIIMNGSSIVFQSNNIQSSGITVQYQFSPVNNTGQTASTEIPLFTINSATTTWLTGGISTQRNIWFKTRTLSFGGISTVTDSYGLFVEASTAGTNATILNNYAAGFVGAIRINSSSYNSTGSTIDSGSTNFYYQTTQSFNSSFFEYYIMSGSNARAGNIMSLWSGSSIVYTETTTNDIGLTNNFSMSVYISGSNAILKTDTDTNGWILKAIIRSI